MGYELSKWAKNLDHPCLTPRTRQVLVGICLIALDEHGEFWMRGKAAHRSTLSRTCPTAHIGNCTSTLVRNGLLIKTAHGGGPTAYGRGTGNQYRVNSPVIRNPHPAQTALPDIVKSPEASSRVPAVDVKQKTLVDAGAVHRRIDEMLATGITPMQMLAIMEFVEETLASSPNMSRSGEQTGHEVDGLSVNRSSVMTSLSEVDDELVTVHDQLEPNSSQIVTSSDKQTGP